MFLSISGLLQGSALSSCSESGPNADTVATITGLTTAEGERNCTCCKCTDSSDFGLNRECFPSRPPLAGASHRVTFKGKENSILPFTSGEREKELGDR